MQKLNDIKEVISYLKDGDIVTSNGKDQFILRNNKINHYSNGNHYGLDIKDFSELYKNNTFYLYEEAVQIDEKKDEEYYRYYKK